MAELVRVFVYGTLKRDFPNHKLLSDVQGSQVVKFLGNAKTVEKYPLVTATQAGIPFLLDNVGQGKHIFGEVYEICKYTLASLDALEDVGVLYDRKRKSVILSNSDAVHQHTEAFVYVITNCNQKLLSLEFHSSFTHELTKHYSSKTERSVDYQTIIREVKGQ